MSNLKVLNFVFVISMNEVNCLPSISQASRMSRTAILRDISKAEEPPVESFDDISNYVSIFKDKRNKQLCLKKYEKANTTKNMMEDFSTRAQIKLFNRRCTNEITDLSQRLSFTKENEKQFNDDGITRMQNFDSYAESKIKNLQNKHNNEWENHLNAKPTEPPAKFRRRSPEFLALLHQERRLAAENKIDEVRKVREILSKMDAIESQKALEASISFWETEGKHIKERQEKEMKALKMKMDTRRTEEIQDIEKQRECMEKRKTNLKYDIRDIQKAMRGSTPHAMRRSVLYSNEKSRSRSISSYSVQKDAFSLAAELPPRSREILSRL